MRRALLLLLTGVLFLAGCNGPKGSPDATVIAYYDACDGHKWEAMASMLAQESIKKFGSKERAAAYFAELYGYVKSIEATVDDFVEVKPGKEAVVRFKCVAKVRPPQEPEPFEANCSETFTLKNQDGKWYIVLPATQRFGTML